MHLPSESPKHWYPSALNHFSKSELEQVDQASGLSPMLIRPSPLQFFPSLLSAKSVLRQNFVKESSMIFVVGHSLHPDVMSKTMNKGFGGVQDTSLLYVDANLCAIGVAGSANKGDITGTSIS